MNKRILPWREVSPTASGDVNDTLEGLRAWQRTTEYAIVSVEPYAIEQLREVVFRARSIRIIGGLKTAALLKDSGLLSRSAWGDTLRAIERVMSITGQTTVLLENESALAPYLNGTRPIPDARLLAEVVPEACARMPLWWYPSAAGDNVLMSRYLMLAGAVAKALPMTRLVDHGSLWGPNEPDDRAAQERLNLLHQRCNQPTIEMFFCHYASGRPHAWPNARLLEAVGRAAGLEVICYPGRENWLSAALEMAKQVHVTRRPDTALRKQAGRATEG